MRRDPKYLIFKDLLGGLLITLKTFFKKPVTVQYPRERVTVYPSFRGRHALVRDPETGTARCVACLKCVQVCPSRCIEVRYEVDPETGARKMLEYNLHALRCIYCGYCEEVCPVGAIVLTEWFEYSSRDRAGLIFDKERLLKNWDEFIEKYPEKVYTNKFWNLKGIPEILKPAPKREGILIKVRD
ncbi:NADH-ubiquinone oxidoreductase [Caldimicrobium thiodismutans]|jgi:NADH-quinone oxidoreductase subunit I|uniref:NADH-quinone oxidoreductase subunit I n=1 Tax=Caldimicrobium thiodismutans TaxID=1653476 RepID=A0A0U4N239_9BACT|nr:NADH-quinone oxidoreductase subunit NuoI [Caldimicrobium thiodismutans]BAU23302.1 NADH-ubiquinone oxidoreductase [Caldimicrobium thiodismutans]